MKSSTITRRLTVAFASVMALILIGGGTGIYFGERFSLDRSLRRDVARQSDEIRELITQPGDITSDDLRDRRDSYIQVLDPTGNEIAATPQLEGRQFLSTDQLQTARTGIHTFQRGSLTRLNQHSFRIRTEAIGTGAQRRIIVIAARRDSRDEALRELIGQLLGFGAIAITLTVITAYLLTRAALRPVERLRNQADALYRSSPAATLDVPTTNDEIAALATTLNSLLQRIQTSIERERAFSAAASHELRTPLTALQAELDLALLAPREHQQLLAAIRDARDDTTRLIRLTEDLLLLRTPEVGVPSTQHELRSIVAGAVGSREIQVEMSDAAASTQIAGSAELLARAIQNLLDNAEQYGAPPIAITASTSEESVVVTVSDGGSGIHPDLAASMFEPFKRGAGQISGTGVGLGLAIVDAIVRAHHGTIEIEDAASSTFRITLPIA